MPTYINNVKIKKVYLGENTKIKKIYYGTDVVFTSGTSVSYYDGSNYLGTIDVESGDSVLYPPIEIIGKISIPKGYVHRGWALTNGGEILDEYNASDDLDSLVLYSVCLPTVSKVYEVKTEVHQSGWTYRIYNKQWDKNIVTAIAGTGSATGRNVKSTVIDAINRGVSQSYLDEKGLISGGDFRNWPYLGYYWTDTASLTFSTSIGVNVKLNGYKKAIVILDDQFIISKKNSSTLACNIVNSDGTQTIVPTSLWQPSDVGIHGNGRYIKELTSQETFNLKCEWGGEVYTYPDAFTGDPYPEGYIDGFLFVRAIYLTNVDCTIVNYYDGSAIIKTECVPYGEDVLHPQDINQFTSQNIVGWKYGNVLVSTLTATGSEMNLEAIH